MTLNISTPSTTTESENEDLNVEHAQLLLFLFHALNLMQKKSILLMTASAVIRCIPSGPCQIKDTQVLLLARLILLLDYLMRHLYDAPQTLIEQIQWNLFNATTMMIEGNEVKDGAKMPSRIYFPWKDLEDNYRKLAPAEEMSLKPRFYSLTMAEQSNQEQPKIDGLACNFILGTPDKLNYATLIEKLIEMLTIAVQLREGLTFTGLCSVQYCFTVIWRILQLLPPPLEFLEKLAKNEPVAPNASLYTLIWGPRAGYKVFATWMKDCLVRQGAAVQYAETIVRNVSKNVNSLGFDVNQAELCIGKFLTRPDAPVTFMELCLMDTLLSRIQVIMDDSISKPPDAQDAAKYVP